MKRYLLFLLLPYVLLAEHVMWQSDYEKARVQALQENKGIMVFLIEKECLQCTKMLQTTFINQAYIAKINEVYVPVLITKDQQSSYPIEMLYTVEYPTTFFLTSREGYEREALRGYATPEMFKNYLQK